MANTVKVVYNACFGGFGLSKAAIARYVELGGKLDEYDEVTNRADPLLAQVVEELGADANGDYADLRIYELQKGDSYRIDEYDGRESVMTRDDYDWKTA